MPHTVFVIGATGTLGGAIARHLLALHHRVHAITRNPDSENAKELKALGVSVFLGDWNDKAALAAGLAGCTAIFVNTGPSLTDIDAELRGAKTIFATAKAAGVTHTVYSSLLGIGEPDYRPGIWAGQVGLKKKEVEQALAAAGFDYWTVVRPGCFMAMFLLPKTMWYPGFVETGRWRTALQPTTHWPMVDEHDIAVFAAAAFADPARFNKAIINLASELRYPDELMQALSKVTGRDVRAVYMTDEEVEAELHANPMVGGQYLMRDMDRELDMEAVKAWGLPLGSFEKYLERHKDEVEKTYGSTA